MAMYIFTAVLAAISGWAVSSIISGMNPQKETNVPAPTTAEPLEPICWVGIILSFICINIFAAWLGWVAPMIILIAIALAAVVLTRDKVTATIFTVAAIPTAAALLSAFARRADKLEAAGNPLSLQSKILMFVLPILAILAVYIIGRVKTAKKRDPKEIFTLGNVLTVVAVTAAVLAVIALLKEVL